MTPKEALEKLLDCIKQFMIHSKSDIKFEIITEAKERLIQALNELERLNVFKQTFDNYELAKKQDFIAYENWQECEKELEELKHDVKRFIELLKKNNPTGRDTFDIELLVDKLEKVGKEE